jgi:hypothetical protein
MDKVLQALGTTIIDESVKTFYQQVSPLIPSIYLLKSPTTNYFDFINSIADSMLLQELNQIDLIGLNSRLQNLLYYNSVSGISFNQNLLMLWLVISTSNDIVIKHKTNGNKLLLLSPENIIKSAHQAQTNYSTNQINTIDIGIIKYKTQISVLQLDRLSSRLQTNGIDVDIMDVIKNILTN